MLKGKLLTLVMAEKSVSYNTLQRLKRGESVHPSTLKKVNETVKKIENELQTEIAQWKHFFGLH